MYLSDIDIRALLPKLEFQTDDPVHPFDENDQIQPCSVDLRLDRVFWRQTRGRGIDLRHARLKEVKPHRHWTKLVLSEGESIKLRPGEVLLGRTFEKFKIPAGHAGKLEGRSSFARMGLAIHCSADFINPGYGGHMPLQLINHGNSTITLVPRVPICQLIVVKLSSNSKRLYGDRELYSKYMNDDGGPSYWWRDKRIKALHATLGSHSVPNATQEEILVQIGNQEPEVLERCEYMVGQLAAGEITNATDLLDQFAKREDTSRKWAYARRWFALWVGPATLSISFGSLLRQPVGNMHYVFWSVTAMSVVFTSWYYFWSDRPGSFLGVKELRELRSSGNASQ